MSSALDVGIGDGVGVVVGVRVAGRGVGVKVGVQVGGSVCGTSGAAFVGKGDAVSGVGEGCGLQAAIKQKIAR